MSLAHASPPKMPAQRWRRKKPIGAGKGATHCPAPNITTNSANEIRNKRLLIEQIALTLERYIWQRANRKQLANGETPLARFRIVGRTDDCHWPKAANQSHKTYYYKRPMRRTNAKPNPTPRSWKMFDKAFESFPRTMLAGVGVLFFNLSAFTSQPPSPADRPRRAAGAKPKHSLI